jgi:hypothetical protein
MKWNGVHRSLTNGDLPQYWADTIIQRKRESSIEANSFVFEKPPEGGEGSYNLYENRVDLTYKKNSVQNAA